MVQTYFGGLIHPYIKSDSGGIQEKRTFCIMENHDDTKYNVLENQAVVEII